MGVMGHMSEEGQQSKEERKFMRANGASESPAGDSLGEDWPWEPEQPQAT